MDELAINEANYKTLEYNLATLARGLNNVMNNIDTMSNAVNKMESKVGGIDNELQSMLEEIKSNTIINNARQNIMFNNSIIEKKFGYYDKLRRNVESLIEGIENNSIDRKSIINLKENIIVNNPRYWLSPATLSLIYWLLDDKEKCSKELTNALKKNSIKTSIFFLIINLELDRKDTAIRWLKYYLNRIDPLNINNEFVTILDLVANGYLGPNGEQIIVDKINSWIIKINKNIKEKQITNWKKTIEEAKDEDYEFEIISKNPLNNKSISNNLGIMSSYLKTLNDMEDLLNKNNNKININNVLYNLIYDYEEVEQEYREDNLKNELIIKTNGNKDEAKKLFDKKIVEVSNKNNILDLFFDITNHKEKYNICNNTIKIAFCFQKEYLKEAYEKINNTIKITDTIVDYEDFQTKSLDGKNLEDVKKEIDNYIENNYKGNDKSIIVTLFIINIIGLFAIIVSKDISILNTIILIAIIFINIYLLIKLNKNERNLEEIKNVKKSNMINHIESAFAEITDYYEFMKKNKAAYEALLNRINSINIDNVVSHNERKINVGE